MADIQQELIYTIQQLIREIRSGSLSAAGTTKPKTASEKAKASNTDPVKAQAERQRIEKALKEGTKALKDAFKSQENYGRDFKVAGAAFQQAVSKLSLKSFDELPKRLNELTKEYAFNFKTKEDIDKKIAQYSEENIKAAKSLYEQLMNLDAASATYQEEYDRLIAKIEKTGFSVEELGDNLEEKQKALGKALNELTVATEKAAKAEESYSNIKKIAGAVLLGFISKTIDATKAAGKFAVDIAPLGMGAAALGISVEELGRIQNENIQGLKNAGITFGEFNKTLIKGSYDLLAFTGSLADGAKLTANLFHTSRLLTGSLEQQDEFMKESAAIFKQMNFTVGETAEQFQALTTSIVSNNDVQVNLYRLGQMQRTQGVLMLQQQAALLRNFGLMEEETKNVIATFAQLGSQGPKERRKQAAQLMAVGGALGVGDEARQLAQMLQRGDTSSPEFAKLTAMIQKKAQTQYANVKGTAGEFAQYALTNLPGVQQVFGQQGPVAALAMRQGMQTRQVTAEAAAIRAGKGTGNESDEAKKLAEEQKFRDGMITVVTSIDDTLKGVFGKGLVAIIGTVATYLAGKGLVQKLLGVGARGAAGAVLGSGAGAAGAAGGAGVLGGSVAAAGVATTVAAGAAAGAAGYAIGTGINWLPKLFGSERRFSDMIVDAISDDYDPNAPVNKPGTVGYQKEMIVKDMLRARHEVEKGNLDEKRQKEQLEVLDKLTAELAILNKKDPQKAIEDLHKTLKFQHQENKEMTQDQIDELKKQKKVKEVKTSQRLVPPA